MIREIEAKTILASVRQPDSFFGLRYNLNLYRGCQHGCIYCDSRSLCYGIENFDEVLVKVNALELLEKELPRKRCKGVVGFGSMSDPYTPAEERYHLTGRALLLMERFGFPVHLTTKSDRILRDVAVLERLARHHAVVAFTITTLDEQLARQVEPGAPPPQARLRAMAVLSACGVKVGVTLMPVLPFLAGDAADLLAIVEQAAAHGACFVLPGLGVTLRDRQRAYFYQRLDALFPGVRQRYQQRYGERYFCALPNAHRLAAQLTERCRALGLAEQVPAYRPPVFQPGLFNP